jgi:hypothetical protein
MSPVKLPVDRADPKLTEVAALPMLRVPVSAVVSRLKVVVVRVLMELSVARLTHRELCGIEVVDYLKLVSGAVVVCVQLRDDVSAGDQRRSNEGHSVLT